MKTLSDFQEANVRQVGVSDDKVILYIDDQTWHRPPLENRIQTQGLSDGIYTIDELAQEGEFLVPKPNIKNLSK